MRGAPQAARGGDVSRTTVDPTAFPDPVVIYLGMCVRTPRGLARSARSGSNSSVQPRPDPTGSSLGLLAFAPARPARGAFSVRRRAHLEGAEELPPMVPDGQAR